MQSKTFLIWSNLFVRIKMIYGSYSGVSFFVKGVFERITDGKTTFVVPCLNDFNIHQNNIQRWYYKRLFKRPIVYEILKCHSSQKHFNRVQTKQTLSSFCNKRTWCFVRMKKLSSWRYLAVIKYVNAVSAVLFQVNDLPFYK